MPSISRREGEGVIIGTPTGDFTVTLLKFTKAENFAMLDLHSTWTGSEGQVMLRLQESIAPRVLAGLVTISLVGWAGNRATLCIDAPREWRIFRGESVSGTAEP